MIIRSMKNLWVLDAEESEWMYTNGVCTFSPTEHAEHLDLIDKVHLDFDINSGAECAPVIENWHTSVVTLLISSGLECTKALNKYKSQLLAVLLTLSKMIVVCSSSKSNNDNDK